MSVYGSFSNWSRNNYQDKDQYTVESFDYQVESSYLPDLSSVVLEEYDNQRTMLEYCIDDRERMLIESRLHILQELSFKDIWEKVKDFFRRIKEFILNIIRKIKEFFTKKKKDGKSIEESAKKAETELKKVEQKAKSTASTTTSSSNNREETGLAVVNNSGASLEEIKTRVINVVEKAKNSDILYFSALDYLDGYSFKYDEGIFEKIGERCEDDDYTKDDVIKDFTADLIFLKSNVVSAIGSLPSVDQFNSYVNSSLSKDSNRVDTPQQLFVLLDSISKSGEDKRTSDMLEFFVSACDRVQNDMEDMKNEVIEFAKKEDPNYDPDAFNKIITKMVSGIMYCFDTAKGIMSSIYSFSIRKYQEAFEICNELNTLAKLCTNFYARNL